MDATQKSIAEDLYMLETWLSVVYCHKALAWSGTGVKVMPDFLCRLQRLGSG